MSEKFIFNRKEFNYFDHPYNETKKKERSIEIPIAIDMIEKYKDKNILEVGNVMSHYCNVKYDIVDKYEIYPRVVNEDILTYKPNKKYDLILSVSTLEHVGWEEVPKDPSKIFPVISNLKSMLTDDGIIFMTIPLGQNLELDKYILNNEIAFDKTYYMKRISNFVWNETSENLILQSRYNYPYCSANQLFIGVISKYSTVKKSGPSCSYFTPLAELYKDIFGFFYDKRDRMGDTLLNVGLSKTVIKAGEGWIKWFTEELTVPFKKVYILEINHDSFVHFKDYFKDNPNIEVIEGDVREASKYITTPVDTTFWFHGPEHIPVTDLPKAFTELNKITKKCMLWGCPWGNYYGLNCGINNGDNHYYYPEDEYFTQFGFNIMHTGGKKGTGHANINAYIFK